MGLKVITAKDTNARPSSVDAEKKALLAALEESAEITDRISRIDGPVFSKPYSRVYRLGIANSQKFLAAKICLFPSGLPDKNFAARQFRELSNISQKMLSASFRVPAPLALFSDDATIIMDWADGEELTEIMRRKRFDGRTLLDCFRRTALWLRHFHQSGRYREEPLGEIALRERIEDARRKLRKEGVDRPTIRRALLMLESRIVLLADEPLPTTWLHGDFQPTNIIVADETIYGLDVAFSTEGVALVDVAHFLNFVERFSRMPKGLHLLPKIDKICRTFEEAYFGQMEQRMRLATLWFQMLDNIAFLTRYFRHTKSIFHRTYLVRMVEMSIKKSMRSIDELET